MKSDNHFFIKVRLNFFIHQSLKFRNAIGMILLFISMIFTVSFAKADENRNILDSANREYSKGNFDKSIKLYESIINKGIEAPELYFNLGNAYYKTNNIAYAILNYERAKKFNSDDEDVNVNLKLANQKTEDKIVSAPQLFLTEWKNGIVYLMTEKGWSELCIFLIIIALVLIAIYISTEKRGLKQLGFFGGTILLMASILVFFLAQNRCHLTKNNSGAIITSASVTVTGSPNENGTKLFILHEGTKVDITEEEDNWTEIKIANGNIGWVKSNTLIPI